MPSATTPDEATRFVEQLVETGSDYIKVMIEEGTVLASPGLPMMTNETLIAAVTAAHNTAKSSSPTRSPSTQPGRLSPLASTVSPTSSSTVRTPQKSSPRSPTPECSSPRASP